ncbi:MAG: excinuclease ABC subunit A [Candidatus Aminicenantes bacterium]|nr:excinuclease ABC subunit A [Candidatus Aminicenantes bacterium]
MSRESKDAAEAIVLRGVRVHNLKNIDLDIPLDRLIIVTGVSGSGKSSLAFDTLYAEGQRRYLESLSSYARQFLERMDKPDADLIEGIPPAIAIQQKASTKNPRSTVATVTEIHDYLRVLFARVGTVHCLKCGLPVSRDTIDAAVDRLLSLPAGSKALVTFAWPEGKNPAALKKQGFFRVVRGGSVMPIDELKSPSAGPDVDVLVDRLDIDPAERDRLADSLELGLRNGGGVVKVRTEEGEEILFSDRLECKACRLVYEEPVPNLFSFNSPQGACPACSGFGDLAVIDEDKVIPDKSKSLEEGAVEPWTKPKSRGLMRETLRQARSRGIPTDVPFSRLKPEHQRFVLEGAKGFYGVRGYFKWLQRKQYKVQNRVLLSRYRKYAPCPECGQARLNPRALSVRLGGLDIGRVTRMTVAEAQAFFSGLALKPFEEKVAGKLRAEVCSRLRFLLEVGLDYITLDRMTFTLSGGEAQRINLAAALGSTLVGALFVLDEPSVGLHARDNDRLISILRSLKDVGNTVVVVEHDPDIIRAADHAVDLGPGAGREGGRVVFTGPMERFLRDEDSLTAQFLDGRRRIPVPEARRRPRGHVEVRGARKHNLKNIDVRIPLGVFTCLTGVSGSGKSTLLSDILHRNWERSEPEGCDRILGRERVDKLVLVDQAPLSASLRSIPATYTKALDDIRTLFSRTREARAQGFGPGMFSFNTPGGRCEECRGDGQKVVEMQFLSDVVLTCEACLGRRFKAEVLDIPYRGKNIHQVLELSAEEAVAFFADQPRIVKKLVPLREVGLSYLRLGQPTTTLSGGELQRIKLAHHLIHERERRILYLFDEPTVGLHQDDTAVLLRAFQRLVKEGHSVCVIEHNLDVIKCADWVIDLGPEGGERGGRVTAEGPPEKVAAEPGSITGRYLRKHLQAA